MQNPTASANDGRGTKRVLLGIALFVLLVGAVAVIVYELKGARSFPKAAGKAATESYEKVMGRIDKTLNDLKGQTNPAALHVSETLAARPMAAAETVGVQTAEAPVEPPAEAAQRPVESAPAAAAPPKPTAPELKGIIWSAKDPVAILNGAVTGVNEEAGGWRVVAIARDRVTVADHEGNRQTLLLYPE